MGSQERKGVLEIQEILAYQERGVCKAAWVCRETPVPWDWWDQKEIV